MSTDRIRELNDAYRCHGVGNGRTVYTRSLCGLGLGFKLAALLCVKSYTAFTKDNDPHGEQDFGSFELDGETIFWKIDLYEKDDVKHHLDRPSRIRRRVDDQPPIAAGPVVLQRNVEMGQKLPFAALPSPS